VARPGVKCPQPGLLAATGQASLCSCANKSGQRGPGRGTAIGWRTGRSGALRRQGSAAVSDAW